jgi:predicted phage terminase large subunit-like protein
MGCVDNPTADLVEGLAVASGGSGDSFDIQRLDEETLQRLRERAKQSLYFFAKGILGNSWLVPHIHKPLCRLLEQYEENPRLKITLPRGWFKSTICSIAYPIWRAIRDNNVKVLIVQNTHTNAIGKLEAIDNIFTKNELFKALFSHLLPDETCTWTREKKCIKRTGTYPEATFEAAGTRTQVVSRHFNVIIEDDTVAPELNELGEDNLAPTKDDIQHAIGWHRLVPPLLTNPAVDQNLVVGTRWFEKDLLSWIDDNEKRFRSYTRSCRENHLGHSDERGDLTFPERFDQDVLDGLEQSLGPYMFSCLYLNKPIRSDAMLFRLDWFQYYETPPSDVVHYTTVDPGGDPEETQGTPDYNVVITCGKSMATGKVYVIDYGRGKWNPGELLNEIFRHIALYKPVKLGIESVQYQKSLLYHVRERMKSEQLYCFVEGITHGRKAKNTRIMGLQPVIKAGLLLFKQNQKELVNEAINFPYGKHDDIIDALCMQHGMWALTWSRVVTAPSELHDPHTLDGAIDALRAERKASRDQRFGPVLSDMLKDTPHKRNGYTTYAGVLV